MSLDGIGGSGASIDPRGVAAAVRTENLAAAQAAQQRFVPPDPPQISRRPPSHRFDAADERPSDRHSQPPFAVPRDGGDASAQAFTAFVVQSIAQEQGGDEGAFLSSAIVAGAEAYARAAGPGRPPGQDGVEIIPPTLSSGHALDLTV
ncbi:hypothetical protein [Magnetospirillum sp. SS-4]|uniref:hypothetical protein n=1 Tax=Magnetospirillum sp. SS-4 TaxID=2681465 RepID=UPI00137EF298|nr:hypothetical protein [Magnetospirillum sp. SS-4]CAA7623325.1 hypothetical protein MTBSS4_40196 [Magnetospirillum sp. SS-4]